MLRKEEKNGVIVATIESLDRLTAANVELFKTDINGLFNQPGTKVALNLGSIKYIDSSGITAFLSAMKTATITGGQFKICNIASEVMRVFDLLNLNSVFDIHEKEETCINSFKK